MHGPEGGHAADRRVVPAASRFQKLPRNGHRHMPGRCVVGVRGNKRHAGIIQHIDFPGASGAQHRQRLRQNTQRHFHIDDAHGLFVLVNGLTEGTDGLVPGGGQVGRAHDAPGGRVHGAGEPGPCSGIIDQHHPEGGAGHEAAVNIKETGLLNAMASVESRVQQSTQSGRFPRQRLHIDQRRAPRHIFGQRPHGIDDFRRAGKLPDAVFRSMEKKLRIIGHAKGRALHAKFPQTAVFPIIEIGKAADNGHAGQKEETEEEKHPSQYRHGFTL